MVFQHIRWQVAVTIVGILSLFLTLYAVSSTLEVTFVPEPGGTYVEGIVGPPGVINPLYYQNQTDRDIGALVFRGLTRISESGVVVPDLARSWDISPDDLAYTFELRNDVRWHDGQPFTAEDVAFTIRLVQDPAFTGRPELTELWRSIRVDVLDPYTVRFTLPQPFAPFLSFTTLGILPAHLFQDVPVEQVPDTLLSRRPVGTGPWRVVKNQGGEITLVPFEGYVGRKPMLGQLSFFVYSSDEAVYSAYRRGEIMGISTVEPEDVVEIAELDTLNLYNAPMAAYTMVVLNLERPVFAEKSVRRALLYGLDRRGLISDVLNGQGIVADTFFLPSHWAYAPNVRTYPYDPERARQLLDEAGWKDQNNDGVREKDGVPLSFVLLTNLEDPLQIALINEISRQWARIGVQAEPQAVGFSGLTQDFLRPRQFDAVLLNVSLQSPDPDLYSLWHSTQTVDEGQNWAGWKHPEADELLVEGRRVLDHNTRRQIYAAFQELFSEEVPSLLLYHPVYTYAVDQQVQDVQVGPLFHPAERFRSLPAWYVNVRRVVATQTPIP
ncbi:MAG: ABC transporter substrate-binding protein [Ardenticatenia bacterium]|nr:ABC transporter substrate-binding protein [Ardenticatenia bacterium]